MEKNKGKKQYVPPSWLNSRRNNNSSESLSFEEDNVRIKSENMNIIRLFFSKLLSEPRHTIKIYF